MAKYIFANGALVREQLGQRKMPSGMACVDRGLFTANGHDWKPRADAC